MPIYILVNGEESGPYDADDIRLWLDPEFTQEEGEPKPPPITRETFAAIEGMKAWRPVEETLFWESGRVLHPFKHEVADIIDRNLARGFDRTNSRKEIASLLKTHAIAFSPDTIDSLYHIVYVNQLLRFKHNLYISRTDAWTEGVHESFPAFELDISRASFSRDWKSEWIAAGSSLHEGRMIARKDDKIWSALSDFDYPFPPFSLDVEVTVFDIEATIAVEAGISNTIPFMLPEVSSISDPVGILP